MHNFMHHKVKHTLCVVTVSTVNNIVIAIFHYMDYKQTNNNLHNFCLHSKCIYTLQCAFSNDKKSSSIYMTMQMRSLYPTRIHVTVQYTNYSFT